MSAISFRPKQVTKKLISVLPERTRTIVAKRFGLEDEKKMTLEAIGSLYDITRERVRQIENFALGSIKKSPIYEKEAYVFSELQDLTTEIGGIVAEDDLLEYVAKDQANKNHINFFLVLGDPFTRKKEDADFKHRWIVDQDISENIQNTLRKLHTELSPDELIPEEDMIVRFLENLKDKDINEQYKNEMTIKRWLGISKRISKNQLGEWGIADSPNIKARGMRDYAYLVIRRHGNPMHFTEVARSIQDLFGKKAHVATCHNELIKDDRFVLVGRGLYALTEWGYKDGVVCDVLVDILRKNGPLDKQEIIDRVLKERYVKPNTILVNLQNGKHFKRDAVGRYMII